MIENTFFLSEIMVRHRKIEKKIGRTEGSEMKKAVSLVLKGQSLRSVVKDTGIKYSTLRRYVKKARSAENLDDVRFFPNYACRKVFTETMEMQLKDYLIHASKIQYGLTFSDVRKLAFEYAKENAIIFPDSWTSRKSAGEDWFLS